MNDLLLNTCSSEGNVGLIKVGAFLGENEFAEKVGYFLSAGYNGTPLSREIAHSYTSYILIAILVLVLLSIISRWILFHKAGKPGWHSLIPVLSDCQEYAICWKGWIGLIPIICPVVTIAINLAITNDLLPGNMIFSVVKALLAIVFFAVYLVESLKLAEAFGKKKGAGILLWITGPIGRLVLGISKAKYQRLNAV